MVLLLWHHIVTSDTIAVPEWNFCHALVKYDITIVQYDVKWSHHDDNQYWTGQYGTLSQYAPLLKAMWPGIDQSALHIYMWHIIIV